MIATMFRGWHSVASYKQLDHAIFIRRSKASAALSETALKAGTANNADRPTADETEWNNAKPFEEMPGLRSVPLLGTTWGMMPIVGIVIIYLSSINKLHFKNSGKQTLKLHIRCWHTC